jgi:hypothetical protein
VVSLETKTSTMRIATEKIVESKGGNVKGKIAQQKLENQIKAIDAELDERIKDIRATPINEEMQIEQAEADYACQMKANARQRVVSIQDAEANIKQAELEVAQAKKDSDAAIKQAEFHLMQVKEKADRHIKQAELTAQTCTDSLEQVKEIAKETEERANLTAKQEYQQAIESVKDAEKAMQRRIDKEIALANKRKLELQQELDILRIQNEEQGSGEKHWQQLYNDVVAISKSAHGE